MTSKSGAVAGGGGGASSLFEQTRNKVRQSKALVSCGAVNAQTVEELSTPPAPEAVHLLSAVDSQFG